MFALEQVKNYENGDTNNAKYQAASTTKMSPSYVYESGELATFEGPVIALYMQVGGRTNECKATTWSGVDKVLQKNQNMYCHTLRGIHDSVYPFLTSQTIIQKLQQLRIAFPDPMKSPQREWFVRRFLPLTYKSNNNVATSTSDIIATTTSTSTSKRTRKQQ